jgi:hypothetical protein
MAGHRWQLAQSAIVGYGVATTVNHISLSKIEKCGRRPEIG